MLCGRILNAVPLSSGFLRIHAQHSTKSNIPLFRRYATRPSRSGNKTRPPQPRPPPQSNVPPSHQTITRPRPPNSGDARLNKIETANRLLKSGDKILYKSGRRTTVFRVNSWAIAFSAALGIATSWSAGLLNLKTFQQSEHQYPILIVLGESAAGLFLGGILGIALKRSWKHIHTIRLIQQSGKNCLQVTYRSGIPFIKRSFIIQPHDFTVNDPFGAVAHLPDSLIPSAPRETSPSVFVAGVIRETLRSISRSFYYVFDYFRAYLRSQGLYKVDIVEGKKGIRRFDMDASAEYLLNEKNDPVLWDIVEIRDPYDNI